MVYNPGEDVLLEALTFVLRCLPVWTLDAKTCLPILMALLAGQGDHGDLVDPCHDLDVVLEGVMY